MTTLAGLNANAGAAVQVVIAIEGIPYLITNDSPSAAVTAFAASSLAGHNDYTSAIGGLTVHWDQANKLDPWKPFTEPSTLRFSVSPATDSSNNVADTFGRDVGRRIPARETRLRTALDCDDTAIGLLRVDDFPATGTVYLGPEAIAYTSRDTGNDDLSGLTRGKYTPFSVSGGGRFARTHKPQDITSATGDPLDVRTRPVVADSPISWIGRWVGVWLLQSRGGTLDIPGSTGHLAFAGTIVEVGDENGATVVTLEDVRRRVFETVLMRDQFTAQLEDKIAVPIGWRFKATTQRASTQADATDLVAVSGAPASANEIEAGAYTATELAELLNAWLASEYSAGRIQFKMTYAAAVQTTAGVRGRLQYTDATAGAQYRTAWLMWPNDEFGKLMGWNDDRALIPGNASTSGAANSPNAPRRFQIYSQGSVRLYFTNQTGTWWDQSAYLPAALAAPTDAGATVGILKVGDSYVRVRDMDADSAVIDTQGMADYFPAWDIAASFRGYTLDDDVTFTVQQVAVVESSFSAALMHILTSTGTTGFNHATYDAWPEQMGCAIPYSITYASASSSLVGDLIGLPDGDKSLCAIIDKPTRFVDLFEADFLLRTCFFYWGGGRLGVRAWTTPSTTLATLTLDDDSKAVPVASAGDNQRSTMREDDGSIYNVIKIKSGRRADGSYGDELTIYDATSIRDYGSRARTIEARNTAGLNGGAIGVAVRSLLESFKAALPLFSRPFWHIKRPLARTHFEQAIVGTVCTFTDKYLRDPSTGLRYSNLTGTGGVSGLGALVIGSQFSWGGGGSDAGGEVELMVVPRTSTGLYVPCAQVDDGAANAGYDNATKTLTCYAHEHTQSTDAADASFFASGDLVRIIEIDPAVAASADSWTRTIASVSGNQIVLTVALSAPSWNTAKKYRVVYQGYSSCTTTQQAHVFQADDADGLVADSRQAYELVQTGSPQGGGSYEESAATEVPARHSTLAYGDGVPLDVGYERDLARLLNNLLSYKNAPQAPQVYGTNRTKFGSGTYVLTDCFPVFVQMGTFAQFQTRKLYVAPQFSSSGGGTANVRISLLRNPPTGDSLDDVERAQYQEVTFSTSSTTFSVPTAQGIDIRHLKLTDGQYGGIGWIAIEGDAKAIHRGLARCYLGPVETP